MKLNWSGNLILEIDDNEHTCLLESVDIEKNTLSDYVLRICGKKNSARVIIPLSRQETKKLIEELVRGL
jgi:hypothetical protein